MSSEKKRSLMQDFERNLKRIKVLSGSSGNPGPSIQSTQQADIPLMLGTSRQPIPEVSEPSSLFAALPAVEPDDNTSTRPASNIPRPQTSKQDPKRKRWTDFKAFAGKLRMGFNSFGPLKEVVNIIVEGIEIFETADQNRVEYEKLRKHLNDLFHDLAEFFDASTPPTMAPTIINFAQGIDRELESVRMRLSEIGIGAHETDADNISEHDRRIQALLQRLTSNVGIKTLRIANEQATETRLQSLPHSPAAKYNSAESSDLRGQCTPDTRVDLLEDIYQWACNDNGPRIYWLNGMAGTGKTTIAYSLCERLEGSKKLAASFFCSRQLPSCRDVHRIVPTLSYQLSRFSRPLRSALSNVLEDNPDVHNQTLVNQFKSLILDPLKHVKDVLRTDLVIVVDALDECDNYNGVDRMLNALLSHAQRLPVKFFVASRPDAKILDRMRGQHGGSVPTELRLHELGRSIVQEDIKQYLTASLRSRMSLSAANLTTLVERSGVLFIYAATVVRYIGYDNFSRAGSRLKQILGLTKNSSNDSEKDMNALYSAILEAALDDSNLSRQELEEMKLILHSVVCALEPLSVDFLAGFLGLDPETVWASLRPLFSVLHVLDGTHIITTLHESFPDYLLNKKRSGEFHCDKQKHSTWLAQLCFKHMKLPDPPFNICKLESSYLLDKDVPDLPARIEKAISKQLLYACRNWVAYCILAEVSQNLVSMLSEFALERFLFWMEVMNLSKNIDEGVNTLYQAQKWSLSAIGLGDDIQRLLRDMWMFADSFASAEARFSTPHIYVSNLTFWPDHSPVSDHYGQRQICLITERSTTMNLRKSTPVATPDFEGSILCVSCSPDSVYIISGTAGGTIHMWNAHTGQPVGRPLEGHTCGVNAVVYSPDGACIVSGSDDKTVRIWDANTRQPVGQPLRGHDSSVWSVAYSPNSAYIASGSYDNTIRIWNAHTSQPVGQPLEGHTNYVTSVAYSPDGAHIVSGSWDKTVRIWDAHTGQPVGQPLVGHASLVWCVAYSPDGAYIVSGSYDNTIRIWDAYAGRSVGQPLKRHTSFVYSVAYSPDGAYIVSGSDDRTIRIWDSHTGQPVGSPLMGHSSEIHSVAYSLDGAHIISGSSDNTIRVWDMRLALPMADISEIDDGQPQLAHSLPAMSEPRIPCMCNLGCQIHCPHMAWTLSGDGWLFFNYDKLIWVPPDLRVALLLPQNSAVMSTRGFLHLDLNRNKLGENWHQYFRPGRLSNYN